MPIIGREQEQKELTLALQSNEAEFIAVHGRRRVGKTFLIREFFKNKGTFFEVVGIKDGNQTMQLSNFSGAMATTFDSEDALQACNSWKKAFEQLTRHLQVQKTKSKTIIFLDELPWMATQRSKMLSYLDHFWNAHWNKMPHVILIVCGSAASWMLKKIVSAKGGLYNRLTRSIALKPFTLNETECYLKSRKIKLNQQQILNLYMIMGGIPHYLKQIQKGISATQNIDQLCFSENGSLYKEFPILFSSLFESHAEHEKITRTIAKSNMGKTRDEILSETNMSSGGTFNKRLEELIASGFVKSYLPYGKKNLKYYRIIDEYTMFYLRHIEPFKNQADSYFISGHWEQMSTTPSWQATAGFLFEAICHKHTVQIIRKLGIEKLVCAAGSWRFIDKNQKEPGAQIDMLFERTDDVINICEIKLSGKPFVIDKAYGTKLIQKLNVFTQQTGTDKQLFLVMITSKGVKSNLWSEELVDNEVTLSDLFKQP